MTSYKIPHGKEEISFEMPSEFEVTIAENNSALAISNITESTKNALMNPINSAPLTDLIKNSDSVCIVVTDLTRPSPDKEILPPLIDQILKKIPSDNLKILIASGLHREMTESEKIEKCSESIGIILVLYFLEYLFINFQPQIIASLLAISNFLLDLTIFSVGFKP